MGLGIGERIHLFFGRWRLGSIQGLIDRLPRWPGPNCIMEKE